MKEKRPKYLEDVIDTYLQLQDERIELTLLIERVKEKKISLLEDISGKVIKKGDGEDLYKVYSQIRKHEERQVELRLELEEVEFTLREFLSFIEGNQLAYERKVDGEKNKTSYLFWLDDGVIRSNR